MILMQMNMTKNTRYKVHQHLTNFTYLFNDLGCREWILLAKNQYPLGMRKISPNVLLEYQIC